MVGWGVWEKEFMRWELFYLFYLTELTDTRHPVGHALGYGGIGGVESFTGLAVGVGNVELAVLAQGIDLAAHPWEPLLKLAFVRLLHDQNEV